MGRIVSNQSNLKLLNLAAGFLILAGLAGCARPQATAGMIQVSLSVDGETLAVDIPGGSSVQQVLQVAGVTVNSLDRINPPNYTTVIDGTSITITRIEEEFEIEQIVIPFERQTVRNETLPEGETRLLQPGENGLQEITYRVLIEAGEEVTRAPVKNTILKDPVPEIVMIGSQSARTPLQIEGTLAYLSNGNAWIIQGTSGNRRPIVTTGDLDGRILRISPDGLWLLVSRAAQEDDDNLNGLWVASLTDPERDLIDLGVENVVHFADWVPAIPSRTIYFSTVEPSPSPPGWQANNDLQSISITDLGRVLRPQVIIESNAGGQYGWWGTNFVWGNDANRLAYVRSDEIGTVDLDSDQLRPLRTIIPFQTLSDWAWVPGVSWGQDDQTIYFIDHGEPIGFEDPQASPVFHLSALNAFLELDVPLSERTGLFAYPRVSPILEGSSAEIAYRIAFLQAITPLESVDSNYRLGVMDRDGSNLRILFPPAGEPGLTPETPTWSPDGNRIAVLYRGDVWVVDIETGIGQPLTSDGQTQAFIWGG